MLTNKIYSKNLEENLKQRAILLLKARNSRDNQLLFKKHCENDPLFFFNMFLFTYKPKALGSEGEPTSPHFPFITYPYQDDFIRSIIECIDVGVDNITEKSREMGFSWMILGIALWGFLFKGWSGLIGSYKESFVDRAGDMDSSFERIRYMIEKLPLWLIPNDLISKSMSISSKELGGAEIGGDAGRNFGTGGRRKWIFLDEFALWENDGIAFRKTKDVTNCRIFGGTPEGKGNIYGKIMTNHPDYEHLDIRKFRLHWSLHPDKTQEWYEQQKRKRTKLDIAQELDISYDNSVLGAVYSDFEQLVTFKELEYNPNFKLYTSWDFGMDSNVCQIWQKDFKYNKLYLLLSFRRIERNIKQFAGLVNGEPTSGFTYQNEDFELMKLTKELKNLYSGHFGDPYNGSSKQTNADQSIQEILNDFGIHLFLKTGTTIESRITCVKLALNRICIDPRNNIDCIESMRQSRYPKIKENSEYTREKTKPVHDENSHHRTAFEYFIDNEPEIIDYVLIAETDYSQFL